MKKLILLIITMLILNLNSKAQGSADQWKYSPSNPSGIRYANYTPSNNSYAPSTNYNEKKDRRENNYTPPKKEIPEYKESKDIRPKRASESELFYEYHKRGDFSEGLAIAINNEKYLSLIHISEPTRQAEI